MQASRLNESGVIFAGSPIAIGTVLSGVKFDQNVSLFDRLAVLHMDSSDDARLKGLDGFGIAAGNDFPLRDCDDIDLS
jgi:hypothetical protein